MREEGDGADGGGDPGRRLSPRDQVPPLAVRMPCVPRSRPACADFGNAFGAHSVRRPYHFTAPTFDLRGATALPFWPVAARTTQLLAGEESDGRGSSLAVHRRLFRELQLQRRVSVSRIESCTLNLAAD